MQVDFLTTLVSVALMVALCLPGFILRKLKLLGGGAVAGLVTVLLYVAQPAQTVFSFLQKDFEPALLLNMGAALLTAVLLHLLVYFAAKPAFLGIREKAEKNVLEITAFLGNVGYMGIPVMRALFPENPEMLLYTAVVIVGFNMVGWSLGVYNITQNKRNISIRRIFFNPPVAALILALPLFFTKAYIPAPVIGQITPFITFLSDMTLPLSMIILGIRLAEMSFTRIFCRPGAYLAAACKLVLAPLLSFALMLLFRLFLPLDPMLFVALFIIMAMPSASLTLSLCEKFDGDRETAVRVNVISTLLCTVTIPLFMLLCPFLV
ncbi:MAG: AEC family transporter [Clostridiales bacterium]|nr:AEC family transporter [Clostridiales bacterium]